MASKAKVKVKPKKKVTAKKPASADAKFAESWRGSGIELSKSAQRLSKLFKPTKVAASATSKKTGSPLVWFANRSSFAAELECVSDWHRRAEKSTKLSDLAVEILEAVAQVFQSNLPESNEEDGSVQGPDRLPAGTSFTFGEALTILGAGHSIRAIAGHCDHERWNDSVARLLEVARAAESNVILSPEVYQTLAIELPLSIALLVPEIEDFQQIAQRCCQKMASSLADMLDSDGWPQARYIKHFGVLSASWIRCGMMAQKLDLEFGDEANFQLQWVVRQTIRLLRPDGTIAFSEFETELDNSNEVKDSKPAKSLASKKSPPPINESLVFTLGKFSTDLNDKRILDVYMNPKKPRPLKTLPKPSNVSQWGESFVLRSNWKRNSPLVAVDYAPKGSPAGAELAMEIARSTTVISGSTIPKYTINGVQERLAVPFEVVCCESDGDIEYVELESETTGGTVVSRQFLLSRSDEFLLLADVIKPVMAARIEYRCRFPLADGIIAMRESETREIYLRTSEIQSLVLPLALPEWKTGRTDDRFEIEDGALSLSQSVDGFGLYAPLFFDLNPLRSRKKRTWRQLTVAEDRSPVPSDVACAYRVQLDEQQWFFYRAVCGKGNRTFFGQNFIGEFSFNRFEEDGKVKPLIVI